VIIYMLSTVVFTFGIGFLPAILSVGRANALIWIYSLASITYVLVLIPFARKWGIEGVGVAQVVFQLAWYLLMVAWLWNPISNGLNKTVYVESET